MAVIIGLLCLCLRRWIPAGWRHGLWLLVFLRLMSPENLGEFRWALPSWPDQAQLEHVHRQVALEPGQEISSAPDTAKPAITSSHHVMPPTSSEASEVPSSAASQPTLMESSAAPVLSKETLAPPTIVPWMLIAAGLWLTGAIAWWACLIVGWLRFRHRVLRTSTPATESLTRMLGRGSGPGRNEESRKTPRDGEAAHSRDLRLVAAGDSASGRGSACAA